MTSSFWRDPVWPEEVRLQTDLSPSAWMLPRLLPSFLTGGDGMPVAAIVPSGFPAYVRVLHPASRTEPDPKVTWRDVDVSWREVADWSGRTYHPLMQFGALRIPAADTTGPSPFTQEPWVGHLFPNHCNTLYSALAEWTTTPERCWLGIWEGWGSFGYPRSMGFTEPESADVKRMGKQLVEIGERVGKAPRFEHPARRYMMARAPWSAICELTRGPLEVTPSLVWPEDHSWCVGTELDFDSTLVAASEDCAAALLSDHGLEVVAVHPQNRLDIAGDVLNSPLG
jgi:hypothetical protein